MYTIQQIKKIIGHCKNVEEIDCTQRILKYLAPYYKWSIKEAKTIQTTIERHKNYLPRN